MKKCVIIGGGLAGLSAAVHLSNNSFKVTLLEASPKAGGRAFSFFDKDHGHFIDNGQHIMMGCYKYTLEMLDIIGATEEVVIQERLRVPFAGPLGESYYLDARSGFYPFNLAVAVAGYKALSVVERISALKFFSNNILYNAGLGKDKLVIDWLKEGGQSENSINSLWAILAVGTLNSSPAKASAILFRNVLREVFLTGSKSAKIVLPKKSLNETFSGKARLFLEKQGSELLCSQRVRSINLHGMDVTGINTTDNNFTGFDFVISAVPLQAFAKIDFTPAAPAFKLPRLESSPILSVHMWLKENPFKERFYSLIGSPVQWLFNNGTHITTVTSAADGFVNLKNDQIISLFCFEIRKFFPYFNIEGILDSLVVREKSATFLPTIASNPERKNIYSPLTNFVFAGDWTDTKLPATIEGAIKSGKKAAEFVMKMS